MNIVYGIVIALIIAMGGAMWVEHANNVAMSATLKAVTSERDTALKDTTTLKTSATEWEANATKCNADSEKYKADQRKLFDANSAALAASQKTAALAAAALIKAREKIDAASRAGPCAAILNTPVCAEALQ